MSTQHSEGRAGKLACDLYAHFLRRGPDVGGFRYVRQSLQEGKKTVRQHVLEIVGSEEFRTKFVRNRPRESVVQHLHTLLFGRSLTDPYRLARQAADLAVLDLVPYVERLTRSEDYQNLYGDDRLPGAVELAAAE